MFRYATLLIAALTLMTANANAQHYGHDSHAQRYDHDYWHPQSHVPYHHVPSITTLDHYSDQLANLARHLHEDAHKLSQDYEHSEAIEHYVDNVDRLQTHMHEILHHAVETGRQSTGLITHVMEDVRQVKSLFSKLSGELQHQGIDGARTHDFYAMSHMRQLLAQTAFPLIRQMEIELYGYSLDGHSTIHSGHGDYGQVQPYTSSRPTYQPQSYQSMRPRTSQPTNRQPTNQFQSLLRSAIRAIR
jgi:hypothetical protein